MKPVNILIIIFAMLLILVSCKSTDGIQFFGETVTVANPEHIDTLGNGHVLELEDEYTGLMNVYDGVLMFTSYKHLDGHSYLYNVETGKRIGTIKRGNGPDEVIDFIFFDNFEKDSTGLHLWISALNNGKLIRVNMRGEFVEVIHTAKFKSTNEFGISEFFKLNDSLIIAYMQGYALFEDGPECIAPSCRVFNLQTGEVIRDYKFYRDYTAGTSDRNILQMWPDSYLFSPNRIKPDKSKLAMAMVYLGRLNILDLESGKVKSIETKDAPDLNLILQSKPVDRCFEDLRCDDKYIYVIESTGAEHTKENESYWYPGLSKPSGRIFVYDWNGNFTNILQVNEDVACVAFDPVRKVLYSKTDGEKVTAYDLQFLYK